MSGNNMSRMIFFLMVKKSSLKNLSTVCRLTVGPLNFDTPISWRMWPTMILYTLWQICWQQNLTLPPLNQWGTTRKTDSGTLMMEWMLRRHNKEKVSFTVLSDDIPSFLYKMPAKLYLSQSVWNWKVHVRLFLKPYVKPFQYSVSS